MKKQFFSTLCAIALFSVAASAQASETDANAVRNGGGDSKKQFQVKSNVTEDKIEQFEIANIGSLTFSASNTVDGSSNSFRHVQKITIQLFPAGNKPGTYMLNFYQDGQNIPEAATSASGMVNLYYPLSVMPALKESLDKALAAKKKVIVKVTQKTDGYREATLVF